MDRNFDRALTLVLQHVTSAKVDGKIGPETLLAVEAMGRERYAAYTDYVVVSELGQPQVDAGPPRRHRRLRTRVAEQDDG